ncbi:MAG: DUF2085 domain-containing protein [Clostridiales bacterium]|nr:DUF2085 domain-containing protein [Clostridiales bacterium]
MDFFEPCSHQIPERSFFIKGYQMPICARCVGVIIFLYYSYIRVF